MPGCLSHKTNGFLPNILHEFNLFDFMENLSTFMIVIGVDFDLFGTCVVVIGGKNSGRWANIVHQTDREKGFSIGTRGEIDPIEIR
jgi:hypothetical protein